MKLHSLLFLLPCLFFYGCTAAQEAEVSQVGSALIADVAQGTVVASDAYAVYQSVNQSLTSANVISGKLSVAKVISGAQAITGTLGSAPTASLVTAANQFVSDVNTQIASFQSAGATVPATTTAISQSGAATVTAIAAIAPTMPPAGIPSTSAALPFKSQVASL